MKTIPADIIASARITADAWGEAHIGLTVSHPSHGGGGRWFVVRCTADGSPFPGEAYRVMATVKDDGTIERHDTCPAVTGWGG